MTILTSKGLILVPPLKDANYYLQVWQLKNYDSYLDTHTSPYDSLAWLNFEADDFE